MIVNIIEKNWFLRKHLNPLIKLQRSQLLALDDALTANKKHLEAKKSELLLMKAMRDDCAWAEEFGIEVYHPDNVIAATLGIEGAV